MTAGLTYEIIQAIADDSANLVSISRQTFIETFADVNTPENMQQYLTTRLSEDKIAEELAEKNSRFYLVKSEDKIIAYLKLNSGAAQTELKSDDTLEIERIYVTSQFKGKGIGNLLMNKALSVAKELLANTVWLGVWEHNQPAIDFYKKSGFVEFSRHAFTLGADTQTDLMMKLIIDHNSID